MWPLWIRKVPAGYAMCAFRYLHDLTKRFEAVYTARWACSSTPDSETRTGHSFFTVFHWLRFSNTCENILKEYLLLDISWNVFRNSESLGKISIPVFMCPKDECKSKYLIIKRFRWGSPFLFCYKVFQPSFPPTCPTRFPFGISCSEDEDE
jgi:hypothetical protein